MKLNKRNKDGSINGYYSNKKLGFGYYVPKDHPDFKNQIEPNIYPAVKVLNDLGYLTLTSCQGHSKEEFEKGALRFNEGPQISLGFNSDEEVIKFTEAFKESKLELKENTTIKNIKTVQLTCKEKVDYPKQCEIIKEEIIKALKKGR